MAKRPGWFIILVAALILWGLAGCAALAGHVMFGAKMAAEAGEWDAAYFAALPGWFVWDYGVAVGAGLLGSLALLGRSQLATPIYWASLAAILIQFGYVFFATDLLAHKGAVATLPFPLFIIIMGVVQIWLANYASKRGWIS